MKIFGCVKSKYGKYLNRAIEFCLKLSLRQKLLGASFIFFLLIGATIFCDHLSKQNNLIKTKQQELRITLKNMETNIANYESEQKKAHELQESISTLNATLQEPDSAHNFLNDLNKLAQKNGLEILTISAIPAVWQISATATYSAIGLFLQSLAELPYFVRIISCELKPKDGAAGPQLNVLLVLSVKLFDK